MERLLSDMRYAARHLLRNPGFSGVAIISLVLGIAANTTIFTLVNGLLLRPLPGTNPEELVTIYTSDYSGPLYGASSYPDSVDFRNRNEVFTGISAYLMEPMLLALPESGEGMRISGQLVSGDFFDLLGVKAVAGRTFLPEEDKPSSAEPAAVVSYGLWQSRLGANAAILGNSIQLNGRQFTVIGVAPAGFNGLMRGLQTDVWVPLSILPQLEGRTDALESRGSRNLMLFARLRHGVSLEQARANVTVIARQLYESYPQHWRNLRGESRVVTVLPERRSRVAPQAADAVLLFVALLLVVVALVLLIACANVANLLLARGAARRKEIAIRLSHGAGRGRLVQQLLTESLFLACIAGILGVMLASWTTRMLAVFQPPLPVPISLDLPLDARVLSFSVLLALGTAVLFGLVPALRATRPDLVQVLKDEGGGAAGGYRRSMLRHGLVVAQIAMSLLLLIGAMLLLRSLANAHAVDKGFNPEKVLLVSMDLKSQGYTDLRGRAFYNELLERVQQISGVETASITDRLPLGLDWQRRSMTADGQQPAPGEDMEHHYATVGPGFFRTIQTPIVRGREFTEADAEGSPGVVVVSEAFARRFWPGEEPLGKWIVIGGFRKTVPADAKRWTVVGVSKDAKYNSLGEAPTPFVFFPASQEYRAIMTLVVRTRNDPLALLASVRENLKRLDSALPLYGVTTLDRYIGTSMVPLRMAATLLGILGGMALLLAAVGIYGVVSYDVSRRGQEIGVRMALGARRGVILRMVLGEGMIMTGTGVALGLLVSAGLTRFATFLLYGISPLDPLTFAAIPALIVLISLAASLSPAVRSMRVAPVEALRYE